MKHFAKQFLQEKTLLFLKSDGFFSKKKMNFQICKYKRLTQKKNQTYTANLFNLRKNQKYYFSRNIF